VLCGFQFSRSLTFSCLHNSATFAQ
jgi:hypothetical protein